MVFYQQQGAEGVVVAVGVCYTHIHARYGFDTRAAAGLVKFDQAEFIHQITDAQGR